MVGTAVGVVFGVLAGRVVWGIIATELGVLNRPVLAPMAVAIVATAMIVSALAIALVPAARARRLRPVELLRAE